MSNRKTCEGTLELDFLQASAVGTKPCNSPDGLTTKKSGMALALASATALPEKAKARGTTETYGRFLPASSESDALQSSLASRLKLRLDSVGSIVYAQTWKRKVTPSGVTYWAHTASERRTGGKGCTGWPSPKTPTGGANSKREERGSGGADLQEAAMLAPWASPSAQRSAGEVSEDLERVGNKWVNQKTGRVLQTNLATDVKMLAPWRTPNATDGTNGGPNSRDSSGSPHLEMQAQSPSPWMSPTANEDACGLPGSKMQQMLGHQVKLSDMQGKDSGATTPSSPAETEKRGSLNPALPRWLMGFPVEWCQAAIRAHRAMPTRRRKPESCG